MIQQQVWTDPDAVMVHHIDHDNHPAIPLADMVRQLADRRPRVRHWTPRVASRLAYGLGIGGICSHSWGVLRCGTASILDGTWDDAARLLNERVKR